jgi:hypothetical protein
VATVTGVYKSKIELMFDEPFIGATSLYGRCHFFRGAMVNLLEIFNLSTWKPFVNLKQAALAALSTGAPLPEWDGQLDQYLLIDQILNIRQECTGDDFGDYRAEHGGAKQKYYRDKLDPKKNARKAPRKNFGKKKAVKEDKDDKEDDGDGGFFADDAAEVKEDEISEKK